MRKDKDGELIHFVLHGTGPESRPAYISMSKERYSRIMPPFLSEEPKVIKPGNLDERCYLNGHTWVGCDQDKADLRNGVRSECLVCGREVIREWEG